MPAAPNILWFFDGAKFEFAPQVRYQVGALQMWASGVWLDSDILSMASVYNFWE